jgi:DNA-binding Lrp family transcriptional regulator
MDKLLQLLETNGRASLDELAETLGTSPEKVQEKMDEYEEDGVLRGYKAVINRDRLEQKETPVNALIEVTTSPQADTGFETIATEISEHPEVQSCYLCSGDYDLLVRVQAEDLQEVAQFTPSEDTTHD